MYCLKKFEGDCLHNQAVITSPQVDVRLKPVVLYSDLFVCRSVSSYTLENSLSNRLLIL